jgi:hypothetical protein
MKRFLLVLFAATAFTICAHAQSNAPGPLATRSGKLEFVRSDREFAGLLDGQVFDRFKANVLTHFDEVDDSHDTVTRTVVQTDAGPVLYDFRARPPLVVHVSMRMTVKRVFWQSDHVVIQSTRGWFRLSRGVLTKLQSSKSTYR